MTKTVAVIMAGGSGTRFWPLSTAARPKQLLPVLGDRSLLQETVSRLEPLVGPADVVVVTGEQHAEAVRSQLPTLAPDNVLVEPCPRNTAPCIGLAAAHVVRHSPDAVLAVLPADHYVGDQAGFLDTLRAASSLAHQGLLVTIGLEPTRPETGYGYIEVGESLGQGEARSVAAFVEKPDLATAQRYLTSGRYLWNSGMFFFTARRFLDELRKHLPAHHAALSRIAAAEPSAASAVLAREYEAMSSISIDYGIMEHADGLAVLPARFPWSDVGHWASLRDVLKGQSEESVQRGRVVEIDGGGNLLFAEDGLVATLGLRDTAVIKAGDVVLVCPLDRAQEVRRIVDALREGGWEDYL